MFARTWKQKIVVLLLPCQPLTIFVNSWNVIKINLMYDDNTILIKTNQAKYMQANLHKDNEPDRLRAIYYEAKKYTEDDLFILATNDVMTEIRSLLLKDVESKLVYIKELLKERVC